MQALVNTADPEEQHFFITQVPPPVPQSDVTSHSVSLLFEQKFTCTSCGSHAKLQVKSGCNAILLHVSLVKKPLHFKAREDDLSRISRLLSSTKDLSICEKIRYEVSASIRPMNASRMVSFAFDIFEALPSAMSHWKPPIVIMSTARTTASRRKKRVSSAI